MNNPKIPRFLILGGTTHANRGDLAMQAGLCQWLTRSFPGAEIRMLASNPELTEKELGVASFHSPDSFLATTWTRETRESTAQRTLALRRGKKFTRQVRMCRWFPRLVSNDVARTFAAHLIWADAVFVPGSGSMNSLWWHDWLYPKAITVGCAAAFGKPIFMTSQGVGPAFTHPMDAEVAGRMFQACRLVGVRDGDASRSILESIGVAKSKITLTGDDALLFESDAPAVAPPAGVRLVGVNLRDSSGYGKKYPKLALEACSEALRNFLIQHDEVNLVFIPISYDAHDDDRKSAAAVAERIALPDRITLITEEFDAGQLRALISEMDVCVGISYHFLMFALSAAVPSVGLYQNPYYEQKIGGLFDLYAIRELTQLMAREDSMQLADRLSMQLELVFRRRTELHQELAMRQSSLMVECNGSRAKLLTQLHSIQWNQS